MNRCARSLAHRAAGPVLCMLASIAWPAVSGAIPPPPPARPAPPFTPLGPGEHRVEVDIDAAGNPVRTVEQAPEQVAPGPDLPEPALGTPAWALEPPASLLPVPAGRMPITGSDIVAQLVARVSTDTLNSRVVDLEGFDTRRATTPQGFAAAAWIASLFQSFGVDSVFVHSWDSTYAPNVVGVLRGTVRPREIYLVGGHYDSIVLFSQSAPGADDNASGTAFVLECARVLATTRFESTLQFACFGAEELGLLGSKAYAEHMQARGDSLVGMLNVDMIGYLAPGDQRDLDIISDTRFTWLRDAALLAGSAYVPELPLVDADFSRRSSSDHASFWTRGMSAIWFFEDVGAYSPYIHTLDDVFLQSYNDFPLATLSTRVGVALLASLAVPAAVPVQVQDLEAHVTGGTVALSWRLAPEAVRTLSGVRVQRADDPAGPYADCTLAPLPPAVAMRCTDPRDDAGRDAWYRLLLVSTRGETAIAGPLVVRAGESTSRTELLAVLAPAGGAPVEIRYALGPEPVAARLGVYDVTGRRVRLLDSGPRTPGTYLRTWDRRGADGAPVARGVYLVHLDAGGARVTRKLLLLRD